MSMDKSLTSQDTSQDTQPRVPLPMRVDNPNLPACDPPQKDIMKDTVGGKVTKAVLFEVMGEGLNATTSVGVTYWINPTPGAKKARETVHKTAQALFKEFLPQPAISNLVDISFMLIAGTTVTALMAPLVNRQEKVAHWVNKKLGKDTDVLPEDQRTYGTPLTMEDQIQQELKKRVHYGQTSRDLWKARWSGIMVPIFGDMALGKWSAHREEQNKWSVDTVSWKVGQHLYDSALHKKTVAKLGRFFKNHGAGMSDVEMNNPELYARIRKVEDLHEKINTQIHGKDKIKEIDRDDRMMIADQTRLLGKEVGWTVVTGEIIKHLTFHFHGNRIRKQESKAIAQMREEGIIPAGVHVDIKNGVVTLTKSANYTPPTPALPAEGEDTTTKWADQQIESVKTQSSWAADKVDELKAQKSWADEKVRRVTATAAPKSDTHAATIEAARNQSANNQTVTL